MPDNNDHYDSVTCDDLEGSREVLDEVLNEGIKPHILTIARAHDEGEVALVFYDILPRFAADIRAMGWHGGKSECVRMNRTTAERFAAALPTEDPCSKWLRGRRPGRVFVFTGGGSLCIEHEPGVGFRLAPGTTDREWKS